MIRRVLVANRGEIARRIFATCRRLGIETVAVHSEADADLLFVREADIAIGLPGDSPADTYLRADLVLQAARDAGADAIHPGYGFLSESADFARGVIEAGLTWIGPSPESIALMGSKIESKKLMAKVGVPILGDLTTDTATHTDLPLLVKASAGGGGRGMRVVRRLADLAGEIEAASAEAASAFGDGTVFVERYVESGRHVEVQVLGHSGGILVLGERDCSIQRRHQKVIEETPAPGLSEATRRAVHQAAVDAASAVDYRGAGTVEFLYDPATRRFFFLEMNTRLQVEHPVTELVHGVDLVELQLSVAEGRAVDPMSIGDTYGHAVEARLYAEDPSADWQPQSGTLTLLQIPGVAGQFDLLNRPGVRLDAGFGTGDEVSTHYDAMLAKVISWAPSREQAVRQLATALRGARIHGVVTNRDLLVHVLMSKEFLGEQISTAFLQQWSPEPSGIGVSWRTMSCHAATVQRVGRLATWRPVQRHIPPGWRNVHSAPQQMSWTTDPSDVQKTNDVQWSQQRGRVRFPTADIDVLSTADDVVGLRFEKEFGSFHVTFSGPGDCVADVDSIHGHVRLELVPRFADPADAIASGSLLAPMPGTVVDVAVAQGDRVGAGDTLLVLEAMKMQHTIRATSDAVVGELRARVGQQVEAGAVLAVLEPDNTDGLPA